MTGLEILRNAAIRKVAYFTVGWAAQKWYNSAFGIYWERDIARNEVILADWRSVLRSAKNRPDDIYISAGNLWSMGPFLETIADDPECKHSIGRIFIRHMSEEIVDYLSNGTHDFLPLVAPNLLDHLSHNVDALKNKYGDNRVFVRPWPKFPRFHGVIYNSHLSYWPWACDSKGVLTHKTNVRFMDRIHDHKLFDDYKSTFTSGFPECTKA